MAGLRSDIQKALDDLISNEEGMRFQGLAAILAKKKWPDLIACERKKDLGADAIAKPEFAAEGVGKVLACSVSEDILSKIEGDAKKIRENFTGITKLIFATPFPVTNTTGEQWVEQIYKDFGYALAIMPREEIVTSLMDPANASLLQTHLGLHVTIEPSEAEVVDKIRAAAADIASAWFNRIEGAPLIDLRARLLNRDGQDTAEIVSLAEIQNALWKSERIVLEGAAGRGKTTALIQLAQSHGGSAGINLLVDLPAWARSGLDLLSFVAGMRQFQSRWIGAKMLAQASEREHFSFLLNGWNEIGDFESRSAETALRGLERDFPASGIIVATRTHHLIPPLPGAVRAVLLTLARRQRSSYLKSRLGPRSAELRPRLDGDRALDELTRTPLILSEVCKLFEAGEAIPSSKLGVLEAVTKLVEKSPEHRNNLQQSPLVGLAGDYLGELGRRMTARGDVSLLDSDARSAVSSVATRLRDAGQISVLPEPSSILSALSAHHLIERQEYPKLAFRFQHQQFQEYYAALDVRAALNAIALSDNAERRKEFAKLYVNEPVWAEPLRMVANEIQILSAASVTRAAAVKAGKLLVEVSLAVDPVFAAELSHLCGDLVWKEVRTSVGTRLRALFVSTNRSYRNLGLAGMLATGSEDFRDVIEPMLASENSQDRLGTYRMWDEFHVSTLGDGWKEIVKGWSEPARVSFVSELLNRRNLPEVVEFAKNDPSDHVAQAAVQRLEWLGAEDEVATLLQSLDVSILNRVVPRLYADSIPPDGREVAVKALQKDYADSVEPFLRLKNLLRQAELGVPKIGELLKSELTKISGTIDDHNLFYAVKPALELLQKESADWVSTWVAERVASGALWRDSWFSMIKTIPDSLRDGLLERAESEDLSKTRPGAIIPVLAATADAILVERVWEKLRAIRDTFLKSPGERHELEYQVEGQLGELLRSAKPAIVFGGLSTWLSEAPEITRVDTVIRVFSRVGKDHWDLRGALEEQLLEGLRTYLKSAVTLAIKEDTSGELMANLASVLSLVGKPEDMDSVKALIRADIDRIAAIKAARARGDAKATPMGYSNWYVRAVVKLDPVGAEAVLTDLLSEAEYEREAAAGLARIVKPPPVEEGFPRKVNYSLVWDKRTGKVPSTGASDSGQRVAAALRKQISTLSRKREEASDKQKLYDYRVLSLAEALAAVDGSGSANFLLEIVELPTDHSPYQRIGILEKLAFDGAVLQADRVLAVVDSVVSELRKYGIQQNDRWLLKRALCVLPFVDDPAKGIGKLRELISTVGIASYELRDVAEAVGQSHSDAALPFLIEIASDNARGKELGDAWINAVATVGSREARKLLLSFVDPRESGLPDGVDLGRGDVLSARIVELALGDDGIKNQLFELCDMDLPADKRALLARVLGQLGSADAVAASLKLINDEGRPPIPFEVGELIESAFVEKRPSVTFQNSYTLEPRSSNVIRKVLLEMSEKDEKGKRSASSLISQIEEWRLEYGRPNGEPRHPAIESGKVWPPDDGR
jgi:hypothetical protein